MLQLVDSLREVYKSEPEIRGAMSYQQMCAKVGLHCAKMGITARQTWTDRCSICKAWDEVSRPAIKQEYEEILTALVKQDPNYMDELQATCERTGWFEESVDHMEP